MVVELLASIRFLAKSMLKLLHQVPMRLSHSQKNCIEGSKILDHSWKTETRMINGDLTEGEAYDRVT